MESLLSITVGILYAAGLFMMMRRSLVKIIIGLILMGQGASLLILVSGGLTRGHVPIVTTALSDMPMADPLPQALVLTAIVISFGVTAFAVVLLHRAYQRVGTDDLDRMNTTEQ